MPFLLLDENNVVIQKQPNYQDGFIEGDAVCGQILVDGVFVDPVPADPTQDDINAVNLAYLAQTDWFVIRMNETGVPVPDEVLSSRASARSAII